MRQVEKPSQMMEVAASELDRFGNGEAGVHRKVGQAYQNWRDANPDRTIGFRPGCDCPVAEPVPCTVLDPFAGAGTTLMVARQLGRNAVGVELNPEYAKMAERRIAAAMNPATYRSDHDDDSPLFVPPPREPDPLLIPDSA